jgi:hypothetical protein
MFSLFKTKKGWYNTRLCYIHHALKERFISTLWLNVVGYGNYTNVVLNMLQKMSEK